MKKGLGEGLVDIIDTQADAIVLGMAIDNRVW